MNPRSNIENQEKQRFENRERLKEHINRSTVELDGGVDRTDHLAQIGRPLSSAELEKRLLLLNPNLHFEAALRDPRKKGIYIIETSPDVDGIVRAHKRFICGYENGFMPEFSIIHTKEKRVPNPNVPGEWMIVNEPWRETRGWRTVLIRLLHEQLITEPQIDRMFNPLAGRSSERWQRFTT